MLSIVKVLTKKRKKKRNYLSKKGLHLCKDPIWMWTQTKKLSDPTQPEAKDL